MDIKIPYGSIKIPIELGDDLNINEISINEPDGLKDPISKLLEKFKHPISSLPLNAILKKSDSEIVIVLDDHTRKFPYRDLLAALLNYIHENGKKTEQITLLIACGTHKPPTQQQINKMLGDSIAKNYKIRISSQQTAEFVDLGTTSRGTPVLVDKNYLVADLKILLTDITLHYFAGYGGGRKSIFPGLAAQESINANHIMTTEPGTGPSLLLGNPIHEDCKEAAGMAGADFTINTLVNSKNEIFNIFTGSLNQSFKIAVEEYGKYYVFNDLEKADAIILSAGGYPYDINYYQTMKALHHCKSLVRNGGKIFLIAECRDGIGNQIFDDWIRKFKNREHVKQEIKRNFMQGGNSAYFQLDYAEKFHMYFYSKIDKVYAREFLRMTPLDDLNEIRSHISACERIYLIKQGSKIAIIDKKKKKQYIKN